MAVMHIYFNFTQPLFIQALMGIKGLYDAKPVSIHLLGNLPVGDLRRPFKVASFFGRESRFFLPLSSPPGFCFPLSPVTCMLSARRIPLGGGAVPGRRTMRHHPFNDNTLRSPLH